MLFSFPLHTDLLSFALPNISNNHLNIVADKVTLSNAFANIKPTEDFDGDERIQPGILDAGILPGSGTSTGHKLTKTGPNGWQIAWFRRCQFDGSILQEGLELWSALGDKCFFCGIDTEKKIM